MITADIAPDLSSPKGRLGHARRLAELSQNRLSRVAGLSRCYVGLVESGTKPLGLEAAHPLARSLGVSLDWLVDGLGDPPLPQAIQEASRVALAAWRAREDEKKATKRPAAKTSKAA